MAFSDTVDRVSVNSSDILLMLPGAEEGLRAIGHYDHVGIFDEGASGIFARRPRDWPERDGAGLRRLGRGSCPDGVTTATLQVGEEGGADRRARRSQRRPKPACQP